jgi:hypothetical protein
MHRSSRLFRTDISSQRIEHHEAQGDEQVIDAIRAWFYRRFYWSAVQRAQYALDRALEPHPDLRALEAKIKTLQASPQPAALSSEAFVRSEKLNGLIDQYESKRRELVQ